jgi:hypothetical protein
MSRKEKQKVKNHLPTSEAAPAVSTEEQEKEDLQKGAKLSNCILIHDCTMAFH